MTTRDFYPDMNKGMPPRVFVTDSGEPESGRVFVWAQTRWFERVESPTDNGAIAFAPIAESEDELADILRERGLSMDELDGDFAGLVKDEFLNDPMLYPDPDQEPVEGEP